MEQAQLARPAAYLGTIPVREKENLSMQMTFYTDRIRSIKKQTP